MGELVSGHLAVRALAQAGVTHLFTLSGAHIFPLYDGARHEGLRLVDTRHEQTAAFAAEGLAKLTRCPQAVAVTAGPGVTNVTSAVAGAWTNGSPLVVLGGRAPQATWGQGSLQELDHVPVLAPLVKLGRTSSAATAVAADVTAAVRVAGTPHRGPTFVDLPMDVVFSPADEATVPAWQAPARLVPDPVGVAAILGALRAAERPVVVAGTDVWYADAQQALRRLAEDARLPVVTNGLGRGCLPADHPRCVSRARGAAFAEADLVVVVGTPLDFRLGYGRFGDAAVVHVADHPDHLASSVERRGESAWAPAPARSAPAQASVDLAGVGVEPQPLGPDTRLGVAGDLRAILEALAEHGAAAPPAREAWLARLADVERERRAADEALLTGDLHPIHPARVYGALREVLDRDAVVVGDGGDFVSFAGRYVDSFEPGHWLDPGPYGCLGTGPGYAAAARLCHPDVQVVTLLGDGAAGFSLMDVDTLVRHRLPVVFVCGNNGIWGLEKHPMRMLYDGWDAAADLRQDTRYDLIVAALGGAGETVERAEDLVPALRRAFDADVPYLINVLTDPEVAYPRSSL